MLYFTNPISLLGNHNEFWKWIHPGDEFHLCLLHTWHDFWHMDGAQGMNEFLSWSHTDLLRIWILITLFWRLLVLILCAFCLSLWYSLYFTFHLGRNGYCSFIAVEKAFRLQSRYDVLGDNSIWRLFESRHLEGPANLPCHFYFFLTDGHFYHSQRRLGTAIVYSPG